MKRARNARLQNSRGRKRPVLSGKGDYKADLMGLVRSAVKGVLTGGGRAIGTALGGDAGGRVGESAGTLISRLTGVGDYSVHHNSLTIGGNMATFGTHGAGPGSTSIKHREFLGEVLSSTGYHASRYPLNVGIKALFPWLSAVSCSFEKYRIKGMIVTFVPTSAAIGTANPSLGSVSIATQYDPYDAPFTSLTSLLSYQFATSGTPSSPLIHPIECAKTAQSAGALYTRNSNVDESRLPFYDLGVVTVATEGQQAADYVLGQLWVTYDVELLLPRICQDSMGGYLYWTNDNVNTLSSTGTPMGGTIVKRDSFANPVAAVSGVYPYAIGQQSAFTYNGNVISINRPGNYYITLMWYNPGGTFSSDPTLILGSNVTYEPFAPGDFSSFVATETVWSMLNFQVRVGQDPGGPSFVNNRITVGGPAGMSAGNFWGYLVALPSSLPPLIA